MARPTGSALRISKDSQKAVLSYLQGVLTAHRSNADLYNKMEAIDIAYARYTGGREEEGETPCNVFASDEVVAPIVVSQVDSMVAYLSEVYLSGYPIFPVVSSPAKRKYAEQLETIIDDHALLNGYARQFLLMFRDGVKYNLCGIEADWTSIDQFQIIADWTAPDAQSLQRNQKYLTSLRRVDPYNLIFDRTVLPGDVARDGDYVGKIELLSRTKLKRLLVYLAKQQEAYNATEAMKQNSAAVAVMNYQMHPTVSDYVSPRRPEDRVDWEKYITGSGGTKLTGAENYELVTLYGRIIPSDFGIAGPQPNTPQIWQFRVINGVTMISAKRIISASDYLPILIGQPLEDGLFLQTQSVAESEIGIQEAATTLYNIRFAAARRAVSDRALYDADMIRPSDINAPVAAPKIPVRTNPLQQKTMDSAYKQIPFDLRGTETTIQDAAVLVDFSKQLSGLNNARQGQFQKGNKSVTEYTDIMGSADSRLRLPALTLEYQVFQPLKAIIALNIFQNGEDTEIISQKTGEQVQIDISELRTQVLSFRIADGYTPKSKLASTEIITQGLNVIMNSPILQQSYGMMLPAMFAHMMQLGGVRGLDEYLPQEPQAPQLSPPGEANAQETGEQAPPGSES